MTQRRPPNQRSGAPERKGIATAEFAVIAPVLLTVVMGVAETSRLVDVKTQLNVAIREGARLAAMDRRDLLEPNQSMNDKIIEDVRHFLFSNGLAAEAAEISIVDPDDHSTPIDLDDPNNEWALFELNVEMPYHAITRWFGFVSGTGQVSASVVFRNGRPL